jgi:integrase
MKGLKAMKIERRHLSCRPSGTYYLRVRVPKSLQEIFRLTEITRSLETKDLKIAEKHSIFLSKMIKHLFHQVERGMIDKDKVWQILAQNIEFYLADQEAFLASFENFGEKAANSSVRLWTKNVKMFTKDLRTNNFQAHDTLDNARSIARELFPEFTEQDIREISREVLKARITESKLKTLLFKDGVYENSPEFKELKKEYLTELQPLPEIKIPQFLPTVSEIIEKYLEDKSHSGGWIIKTKILVKATLDILKEIYGDRPMRSLTRDDFVSLRNEVLMKLPVRHAMMPKYRGKPIAQILKIKNIVPMSTITINNHLSRISSFVKWALDNGHTNNNYAADLQLKSDVRPDKQRDVFNKEDLEKMLTALSKLKTDEKRFKYWIPLLGLFSGARENEIAQLYLDNIFIHEGIPCLDISVKHDDQSLKTQASYRKIPIHPALAHLGFIKFLIGLKKNNVRRLWIHLSARRDGYGQSFQRWFSRFKNAEITTDKKKVFHSLRHTFTNNLKQNGVPESVIAELVGHNVASMTYGRYGKRYEPKPLLEALLKLDYEIDYFKLLDVKPLSKKEVSQQIQTLNELLNPDSGAVIVASKVAVLAKK